MNKTNKKFGDILVVSFALFAMFFGAGNLIFPPQLGAVSGGNWVVGFSGFFITEIGLTVCGLLAIILSDGDVEVLAEGLPAWASAVIFGTVVLIIGPLYAVPRTAAVTFEIAFQPVAESSFLGPGVFITNIVTNIIFFAVTLIFVITPSSIIDKIGKFLTPFLLFVLAAIILKGIFFPLAPIPEEGSEHIFALGVREGYQTMDALGTILFGVMVINTMREKGYTEKKSLFKISIFASIGACIGLTLVYGGLAFLGATSTSVISTTDRVVRIRGIAETLWGPIGSVLLGFSIALACLTTAIGLIAAVAGYFHKKFNIPMKPMFIVFTIVSFFISIVGVNQIITIAAPVLEIVYPIVIVLIFMTFLRNVLPNFWFKRGAVIATSVVGAALALSAFDATFNTNLVPTALQTILEKLPFYSLGFAWILPAIVSGLVAGFAAMALQKK
ncbi:MAG: branched-chain amino acid transport system II carrier protein [Treponemataceae bacterium]